MDNSKYSLLELGGSANVIISAICDFETGTKSFLKNDIVLVLDRADIKLNMSEKNSQSSSVKLNLDYNFLYLQSLSINGVPFTQQIYNLLGVEKKEESIIQLEEVTCVREGMLLLKEYVSNKDSVKVYGVDKIEIVSDSTNQTTMIYSDSFLEGFLYNIQYLVSNERVVINLDTFEQNWPYMRVQLELLGNQDKETMSSYIIIDKASLHCSPWLNFNNSDVTHCSLHFNVIDDIKKPRLVI